MNITLPPESAAMFQDALDREAARLASEKLFDGSAAVKLFNIPRGILQHIPGTYLPGRRKPMYSARNIQTYLASKTYTKHPKQ